MKTRFQAHFSGYLKTLFLAVVIFVAISGLSFYSGTITKAVNDPPLISFSGYAWSDTIGWISLNCSNTNSCGSSNYKVVMDPEGVFSGYAWSESIGWISFNGSDVAGCPGAVCDGPRLNRYFGSGQGIISGWAKAIAGSTFGSGGWDGFIKFSNTNPTYAVTAGAYNEGTSGTALTGFAWGGDGGGDDVAVTGWIDFTGVSADSRLVCRSSWKQACSTPPNSCGLRNHGLVQCDGSCNQQFPPPESHCSDRATTTGGTLNVGDACERLTASPKFVGMGGNSTLSWDGSCQANACRLYQTETGQIVSTSTVGSVTLTNLTDRRTYVFTCTNDVTLTVGPSFEFREF